MDVAELVSIRLNELGYEQQDLADAVGVTPSFISQLLKRKKQPPSPDRTTIYNKIEKFLSLRSGDLSKLADLQRKQELRNRFNDPPEPLFENVRELVLNKCKRNRQKELKMIFEKEPFGEIERIVTQKLLDVTKEVTRERWSNEKWLQQIARANEKSFEEMRLIVIEFLDSEIYDLSIQNSIYFIQPLIQSWDIELSNLRMSIVFRTKQGESRVRKFGFIEMEVESSTEESGLKDFLRDRLLCMNLTEEEARLLKSLRFEQKKPNALFYYHVLQNIRDPLHFRTIRRR